MENITCSICKNEINKNDNYCSHCGAPLSNLAKDFEKNKKKNQQLLLIYDLIEKIDDVKTIKLLQKFITKIDED